MGKYTFENNPIKINYGYCTDRELNLIQNSPMEKKEKKLRKIK